MDNSSTHSNVGWQPALAKRPPSATALAAIVAAGIGLLLGSIWASRAQDVFGGPVYLPGGRAVATILLVLWGCALARRPVGNPVLLPIAAAAVAGHIGCLLFARFAAAPQDLAALGFAACVIDGIFITVALPSLLNATLRLDRTRARLAIAFGFLVATAYSLVFSNLGAGVGLAQWVVADLAVLTLCALCLRDSQTREAPAPGCGAAETPSEPQAPAATLGNGPLSANATQGCPPAPSLVPWAAATVVALALMLVQGFVVQATGYGATGEGARFGAAGDILSFTTRVLVVLYCVFVASSPRPVPSAATLALIWCVALVTTALGWGTDAGHLGELLLETGYNVLQTVILLWAYEVATARPAQAGQLFCLASAVMLSNQLTRIVGLAVLDSSSANSTAAVVDHTVVVALGAIATAGTAAFFLMWARGGSVADRLARSGLAQGAAAEKPSAGGARPQPRVRAAVSQVDIPGCPDVSGNSSAVPPFAQQEADFCRRFELACNAHGLTQREREILFTAIHGYTIDNIADRLSISRETVKSGLARAYARAYARAGVNGKQAFLTLMDEQG